MTDNTCNCDEFKKALEKGSGDDAYFPAIWSDKTNYEIAGVPINFCPWCGKNVPTEKWAQKTPISMLSEAMMKKISEIPER